MVRRWRMVDRLGHHRRSGLLVDSGALVEPRTDSLSRPDRTSSSVGSAERPGILASHSSLFGARHIRCSLDRLRFLAGSHACGSGRRSRPSSLGCLLFTHRLGAPLVRNRGTHIQRLSCTSYRFPLRPSMGFVRAGRFLVGRSTLLSPTRARLAVCAVAVSGICAGSAGADAAVSLHEKTSPSNRRSLATRPHRSPHNPEILAALIARLTPVSLQNRQP